MVERIVVQKLLASSRPLVFAMVHVPALPGTPSNSMAMPEILKRVRKESEAYLKSGVDGVIVENMHDVPYVKPPIGPEIVSAMSLVSQELKRCQEKIFPDALLGIQILAAANKEAIAVAHNTGLNFIRAEGFIYSHVADEGWIDGCAGGLLRYRASLKADQVAVFTDIKKKHSAHTVTSDVSIAEMAKDAQFNCADGVIVTGSATGSSANRKDLKDALSVSNFPVLIGSGMNSANQHEYSQAHGFIVGSEFKKNANWKEEIVEKRVVKFMNAVKSTTRDTNGKKVKL